MSLSRHFTSSSGVHGRLKFHPDCPHCRAERLAGQLGDDRLLSRRAQAALAAGLLAFSVGAAPAAALGQGADQEQEGSGDPAGEGSGLETDFDPGADYDDPAIEIDPIPNSGNAGGSEDDGQGAPVEAEPPPAPVDPPEAIPEPPQAPAAPHAPVEPAPEPAPPPAPVVPTPPAVGTPPAPPPADPDSPEALLEAAEPKAEGPGVERRVLEPDRRVPQPRSAPAPSPAPAVPAPAPVAPPAPRSSEPLASDPPQVVPVSQTTSAAGGAGNADGGSYTVQPGDSLWAIARSQLGAGASAGQIARLVSQLWELNHARIGTGDPDMLHVGTVLRLP